MSNYATKSDLTEATGIDTSKFAVKTDLANIKSDNDNLHIDQSRIVPFTLRKPSNVVKEIVYIEFVKNGNNLVLTTSNLVKKSFTETEELKILKKIPNRDKYITTDEFNKLKKETFPERLK